MPEKTEAPTPRRRAEARQRGEVARSPEVNNGIGILVGFLVLRATGPTLAGQLAGLMRSWLSHQGKALVQPEFFRAELVKALVPIVLASLPLLAALLASGMLASTAQVGMLFTAQPLKPSFDRINPLAGARRLFSTRGAVSAAKAMLKVGAACLVAYLSLRQEAARLPSLSRVDLGAGVLLLWGACCDAGVRIGLLMLVIAGADYLIQWREHEKNLRMTRQELIEELKRYENPFIRARVRQQQRRMAMQRMMAAVPKADVVITNPTELAVALEYKAASMRAPVVVAKGQRLMAERIRRVASEHGVPIVERPPLARLLYRMVDVGAEIPPELYQAVAEVLAFIYSLKGRRS
jgi:flagellar biosynthetic protein FlhB